jgi:predicted DNA-binding transcriptional regulator AlpA
MKEVTALVEMKRRTVERWIQKGKIPAPGKLDNNSIVFRLADLVN